MIKSKYKPDVLSSLSQAGVEFATLEQLSIVELLRRDSVEENQDSQPKNYRVIDLFECYHFLTQRIVFACAREIQDSLTLKRI